MSKYKYWKYAERQVAKKLDGRRILEKGIRTHDVETDWLKVEVKTRQALPQWLTNAALKIRTTELDHKLGILVLKGKANRTELVVLHLKDFKDWFGEVKHA